MQDFMTKEVYPHYANVHSEVGHCAGVTGGLVVNARDTVLEFCGANVGYSVIFGGSGMTGAGADGCCFCPSWLLADVICL